VNLIELIRWYRVGGLSEIMHDTCRLKTNLLLRSIIKRTKILKYGFQYTCDMRHAGAYADYICGYVF
jgi:hypothetical protein